MRAAERFRALTGRGRLVMLVRAGLALLALAATVLAFYDLVRFHPIAVDLDIPLRAAERWTRGDAPYLASSFAVVAGRDLPFLYPPFTLPVFATLLVVPRTALVFIWLLVGLVGAGLACRRLGIPPLWMPVVLMWPPFAEALIGGNIQIWLFVAFAYLYWAPPAAAFGLRHRSDDVPPNGQVGILAASIAALKVTQIHAWIEVLRRSPRAALIGAAVIAAPVLITLPIVGPGAWIAWVEQLGRAADPNWVATGIGFNRFLPPLVVSALAVGSVAAVVLVPRPIAGYWVGLLMVLGAASLRIFTVLFMLPALLRIRIEPALVAVTLISLYGGQPAALWLGIALVAIAYVVWPRPSIADDEHLRSEQVARTLA